MKILVWYSFIVFSASWLINFIKIFIDNDSKQIKTNVLCCIFSAPIIICLAAMAFGV